MAQALASTPRFRRRLLGYDRREVTAALTAKDHELERAVARRDELVASSTNVERIGAEVAEMLRSLADRAIEVEAGATAKAQRLLDDARADAEAIRNEAAAVLATAHAEAEEVREASRARQAAVSERRESAVTALHVAMEQMRRLTGSIEEIDVDPPEVDLAEPAPVVAVDATPDEQTDTVVVLPKSDTAAGEDAEQEPGDDPIDPALARLTSWVPTSP